MGYPYAYTMARWSPTPTRNLRAGFWRRVPRNRFVEDRVDIYACDRESAFRVRNVAGTLSSICGSAWVIGGQLHTSPIWIGYPKICAMSHRLWCPRACHDSGPRADRHVE
jgi:hypothetical protein